MSKMKFSRQNMKFSPPEIMSTSAKKEISRKEMFTR